MNRPALLIPFVILAACAEVRNTRPDGSVTRLTMLGTNIDRAKLPDGTELEGVNNSLSFREGTRFATTTAGAFIAGDVAKAMSADSIAVDQASVKAGQTTALASEKTKQVGIKEASKIKQAEIKAAESIAQ